MVSVAMATYNGEKFIIEQLDSIRNQTVTVDQVIINDDGSTDQTVSLIEEYIKSNRLENWSVEVNERNLGFSRNFFRALRRTSGDYVFLCDQDDVWHNDKAERMLAQFGRENVLLAASRSDYIDADGAVIKNKKQKYNRNIQTEPIKFSDVVGISFVPGCAVCIKKPVIDVLKANPDVELSRSLGHDWYLLQIAAILGECHYLNMELFSRRIHGNNASMGSLKKTTALATSSAKRNASIEESLTAHLSIRDNALLAEKMSKKQKQQLGRIIQLLSLRLKFLNSGGWLYGVRLLFNMRGYMLCGNSAKLAVSLYLADIMYRYEINPKLKKRERE